MHVAIQKSRELAFEKEVMELKVDEDRRRREIPRNFETFGRKVRSRETYHLLLDSPIDLDDLQLQAGHPGAEI